MLQPAMHSEIEGLLGYLDEQLLALRTSSFGLSEQQARATPCTSTLSIGGLLKHATWVLAQVSVRETEGLQRRSGDFVDRLTEFEGSFVLGDTETLDGAVAEFDRMRDEIPAILLSQNPDEQVLEPPAPWDGRNEPVPARRRFHLVHLIEELARHAGHADIIREEIDGAAAMSLALAVSGRPGNAFIQPWRSKGGPS